MRVFSLKKSSPSRSTGSTTIGQRSESAAPIRSTASRSVRMTGPFGSQFRIRMPLRVSMVSAMASRGSAQEGADFLGRRRNEVADLGIEMNLRLRQQLFRAPLGVVGIDHRVLAADEDGDRHLERLQRLI